MSTELEEVAYGRWPQWRTALYSGWNASFWADYRFRRPERSEAGTLNRPLRRGYLTRRWLTGRAGFTAGFSGRIDGPIGYVRFRALAAAWRFANRPILLTCRSGRICQTVEEASFSLGCRRLGRANGPRLLNGRSQRSRGDRSYGLPCRVRCRFFRRRRRSSSLRWFDLYWRDGRLGRRNRLYRRLRRRERVRVISFRFRIIGHYILRLLVLLLLSLHRTNLSKNSLSQRKSHATNSRVYPHTSRTYPSHGWYRHRCRHRWQSHSRCP